MLQNLSKICVVYGKNAVRESMVKKMDYMLKIWNTENVKVCNTEQKGWTTDFESGVCAL